jgi:anti-anti-sigma factor
MAAVTFVDAEGLRALAAASRELEWRDCELRLRNPSLQVQRILQLTAMDKVITVERLR